MSPPSDSASTPTTLGRLRLHADKPRPSPPLPAKSSPSPIRSFSFSRCPSELGGVQSLLPLHSTVAAARLTSCLSTNSSCRALFTGYSLLHLSRPLIHYVSLLIISTLKVIRNKRSDNGSDLSIFLGDLAADVTDSLLHETFASKYMSVKAAKVVFDANTGRSKGYGFVRFGDDSERTKAMTEMNGAYCSTRPMRIGAATPRKSSGYQNQYSSQGGYTSNGSSAQGQPDGDSTNTTIFVGGLDSNVTDEDLKQPFSQYGEIVSVKIPLGKGCGFVQFANRNTAEEALQKLNGTVIGNHTVRLSWGRNPANKQIYMIPESNQQGESNACACISQIQAGVL